MKKTKTTLTLSICLAALMMLSSCAIDQKIIINPNMTANAQTKIYLETEPQYDQSEVPEDATVIDLGEVLLESGFEKTGQTVINGKECDIYVSHEDTKTKEEMASGWISYDDKKIVFSIGSSTEGVTTEEQDTSYWDFCNVNISVPKEIKLTNAKVSDDKKSISIDVLNDDLERVYIVFDESIAGDRQVTLNAVNGKYYNKSFTLKAKSENVITKFTVNDKEVSSNEYIPAKDGRYNVYVELLSGASKKISYVLDRTKPYTNIVNGKTYKKGVTVKLSDKYGIKAAYLNGKIVKTGRKVTKAGAYTLKVYDKAGNTTVRKFKVKA